jgi:asparagine synthase (glutamine-hydrolysing)
MCGIAGLINFDNSYVKNVQKSLYHRGPDAQTDYHFKNVDLIHTRLSIQDIKHGSQPFEIGQHVIIFNGEIYNHLELRKKITNYTFNTLSDTETLLALYIQFGISALNLCDGMFAFVILDKKNNKLILARDRIGKKPLYIYKKANQVFFASELNALLHSLSNLLVDEDAIAAYIRSGFFFKNTTPYKDVKEVLPGHVYEIDIQSLNVSKSNYFNIEDLYKDKLDIKEKDLINELDSIMHQSIKDRLLSSDLDVGAFLSSGIDSSLIIAIASQYVSNLKTFTVKFDEDYDESYLAGLTAQKFSTNHNELNVSMDLKNDVERILTSYGEPFMDSSAIPSFYISQEAKKYVTVVLNGDGADELFGGYRRYVPIANNWNNYAKYFSFLTSIMPISNNKQSNYNYLYRLLAMSDKSGIDFYLSATTDLFEDVYSFKSNKIIESMDNYIEKVNRKDFSKLSKMLILDANLILPSDLLKKMDIATMSNSLEGRSPFLSKYMLEWAPKISDKHKIKGTRTKNILRELALKYSLTEVYNQPKKGFEVPLKKWVDGEIKENIFDSLGSSSYSKSYVDSNFIEEVLNGNKNISKEKRAKILWNLYSLEIWHNNYSKYSLENEIPSSVEEVVKKIHILFLATGLGLGGAERVVLDICSNINHNYYKTKVIGVSTQKELLPEFNKNSIETSILGYKKTFRGFFNSFNDIYYYVRKNNVNIIHAHMFHTLLIATLMKFLKPSLKVVFTPHNTFESMRIRRWCLWLLKPFRDIDTIFSKDSLRFFHKQDFRVVPNGIDVTKYSYISQQNSTQTFTFVIVGRLEYMKNHNFLIDIIYQLNQLNKYDFQLKIVGSGNLENALKSKVENLELNDVIDFLGARDDVPTILKNCDCLLLPSLWEAFPIVLLEAAASNIPVITTSVGSISNLVDQNNGYIVELDKFKDAMIDVLENYNEAKSKSLQLFNKVKSNYQIKNIVKKYESIYQKLLQ